jgi:hypothetical protein
MLSVPFDILDAVAPGFPCPGGSQPAGQINIAQWKLVEE